MALDAARVCEMHPTERWLFEVAYPLWDRVQPVSYTHLDVYKRQGHGLGHSVGIDIHEDPRFNQSTNAVLKAGQIMTVEPGICLPGVGGVRIENSVAVLEGGCEVLTHHSRELIIL